MIGNAVPVNLARFVGTAIQDYISERESGIDFSELLSEKPLGYEPPECVQLSLFEEKTKYK